MYTLLEGAISVIPAGTPAHHLVMGSRAPGRTVERYGFDNRRIHFDAKAGWQTKEGELAAYEPALLDSRLEQI